MTFASRSKDEDKKDEKKRDGKKKGAKKKKGAWKKDGGEIISPDGKSNL